MRLAKKTDKQLVVSIIVETFKDNPGVNWMFSTKGSQEKKLRLLAEFAFIKCYNRNGVLISSNNKGVALFYRSDKRKFSLTEIFFEVRFGLLSIPFNKILEVLKRESVRKSKRSPYEPYYYFWFVGALKEGAKAGLELNRELIKIARKENVTICLETTIDRNKYIYERLGYETYDSWTDDTKGIKFWFLKRGTKSP